MNFATKTSRKLDHHPVKLGQYLQQLAKEQAKRELARREEQAKMKKKKKI
jgi:hypothetical protein